MTASDVAAILGLDPHREAMHVYASKTGAGDEIETEAMRRGKLYEAAIADDYAFQTGRTVLRLNDYVVDRHPKYDWIGATFDRITLDDAGDEMPLELKLAVGSGWAWKEEIPKHYQLQAHVQAAVFGSRRSAVAGFVGHGPLATADLDFDAELFELLVPKLHDFLEHVRLGVPPEPQSGLSIGPLKRIFKSPSGETIELHEHRQEDADMWENHKAEARRHAEHADTLQATLRHALGGAQFGRLKDGSLIERKIGKRSDTLQRVWPKRRR